MARSPTLNQVSYPDSDGQPMSDNTKQFHWIVYIKLGCEALFKHDSNVFIAGDLLWYPVEGSSTTRAARTGTAAIGQTGCQTQSTGHQSRGRIKAFTDCNLFRQSFPVE